MAFLVKSGDDILRQALRKISTNTDLTATGPGSILRALTETITSELGDFYDILDFNFSQQLVSTATGRALDLLGSLYNIQRKTLTDVATIDAGTGSFYFFIDNPYTDILAIPQGTRISTDANTFIGSTFQYETAENVTIQPGRLKAWVGIRPLFADSVFTAGANTLTVNNFQNPPGVVVKCTNPKPIAPQVGFEDDDSYRTRIINGVRVAAGGTVESVRFAGLNVTGVRDITVRDTPYGLGSCEAIVVLDNTVVPGTTIAQVANTIETVRPVGVRMFVRQPDLLPLDIDASILLRDIPGVDKDAMARRAQVAIMRYINTMLAGSTFVYAQLLQTILDSADLILDASITNFAVNGSQILRRNYTSQADQLLVPGTVTVNTSN